MIGRLVDEMRKKIKYQGAITKILCHKLAEYNKNLFRKAISKIDFLSFVNTQQVDFDIISFSGKSSFEDQILSIYSFITYGGIPQKWTIYSDKTYTETQMDIFKEKFPFVLIKDWDTFNRLGDNAAFNDYYQQGYSMAKKLNVILGHPHNGQTIYVDSDILCYGNMGSYLNCGLLSKGLWYTPDPMWGDVAGYFDTKRESIYPLNAGFLILNKEFNQDDVVEYFESLKGKFHYFSEQSSFEYAFRKQNANILDPRQFVIDTSDQFDLSTKYYPSDMAMRHYTTPVRHKIWQNGWKWHFKA